MKPLPTILLIAMTLSASVAAANDPQRPAHIAIVIDGGADAVEQGICDNAERLMHRLSRGKDYVGAWIAGDGGKEDTTIKPLKAPGIFKRVEKRLVSGCRRAKPAGDLTDALEAATNTLDEYIRQGKDGTYAIVLLYAGSNPGNRDRLNELRQRLKSLVRNHALPQDEKCPQETESDCSCNEECDGFIAIHAVAIGKNADESTLKKLARSSGGVFYNVNNSEYLPRAVERIGANLIRARAGELMVGTIHKIKRRRTKQSWRKQDDEDDLRLPDGTVLRDDDEIDHSGAPVWVWWLIGVMGFICVLGITMPLFKRLLKQQTRPPPQQPQKQPSGAIGIDANVFFDGDVDDFPEVYRDTLEVDSHDPTPFIVSAKFVALTDGYDTFEVNPKSERMTIGRKIGNNIVIADATCSSAHAELRWRQGQLTVIDKKSSNGTFVNDKRITECAINPDDVVRFGAISYRVAGQTTVRDMTHRERMDHSAEANPQNSPPSRTQEHSEAPKDKPHTGPQQCIVHPNRAATKLCDDCGQPFCSHCLKRVLDVDLRYEDLCVECRQFEED